MRILLDIRDKGRLSVLMLCFFMAAAVLPSHLTAGGLATSDFNYINDLIGGRATGLGGAYTAISDDPSGAYYNPAGLVFAFDNQISLSVNSYKKKNVEMDKAVSGKPYTQEIESFYPSFFGVVQSLGRAKIALTIINLNNEILDQDDYFSDITATAYDGTEYSGTFNINYNLTDNTLLGGLSFAMFVSDSISVGATLYGLKRRREQIANQVITFEKTSVTTYEINNQYITESIWGMTGSLGIQIMPAKILAIGLSFSGGYIFGHDMVSQVYYKQEDAGSNINEQNPDGTYKFSYNKDEVEYTDSKLPYTIRGGVALFPSRSLLFSADVIATIGSQYYQTEVENTINGALGMEYYVTRSFPVRVGLFTNFANTPAIDSTRTDQEMNVDMYGASLSLSWQTKNSSITLSGFGEYGKGDAQVISGSTSVQDTTILVYSISLTGTAKY